MMTLPSRSVVVTGASSGIGRATATLLADEGMLVFAGVRREADLESLGESAPPNLVPILLDVTDDGAVAAAARAVETYLGNQRLHGLVNNAGLATFGPLAVQPLDSWSEQIQVNLVGTLRVTQALLPLLGTDPGRSGAPGRIVNVSSVSGRMALPFTSGYSASKHGLEALSDCMRRELEMFCIRTIVVQPGPIATPIWGKVHDVGIAHRGTPYELLFERFLDAFVRAGEKAHSADQAARLILHSLSAPRPRPRYALVRNRLVNWSIPRRLSDSIVDRILKRQFQLSRSPAR
ncbi:SDR family oxidoreductase [Sphingosinicella rhizophila]|uniref:SDR family oxidoreductase n=1 Tax=Sphingosinicella rhizophila TaxID=3050082 RepID=A0ABU3Q674_9SPHN|nr:SDR family oxidoreductase [Sphingosinicella sp. GR2756]MDT9598802.1 SDR family oxidoreductase [Sphingosinicella sp. GR2756]